MIGILNAFHFKTHETFQERLHEQYQEQYSKLMINFVKACFPEKEINHYLVGQNQWPSSVEENEIWFITGSEKSVYDCDDWIIQLAHLTRSLYQHKKKIIGICFGHQLIAHALGGKVRKNPQGWGLGVRSFEMLKSKSWMTPMPDKNELSLLFIHQDQVFELPPGAQCLASDPFCPFQIFEVEDQILSLQGHPELSPQFIQDLILRNQTHIKKDILQSALESLNPATSPRADEQLICSWIQNFCR